MKAPPFARFNAHEVLAMADSVLRAPPAKPHIVRVPGKGRLLRRFALPLELCPTTNGTRHQPLGVNARTKANIRAVMLQQTQGRTRAAPLPGRPMLRCIRFSSREPDKYSDWMKMAIDRLMVGKERLGYLVDDSPRHVLIEAWWEKAPAKQGFAVIEIWTGAAT